MIISYKAKEAGVSDVYGAIGLNILTTLVLIVVVNSMLMLSGVFVSPWNFVGAFAVSQILCFRLYNRSTYVKSLCITIALWVLTVAFATWLADSNYDGVHHHQEMVLYMIDDSVGYNYFSFNTPETWMNQWVVTHPLGMESMGAPFSSLTGNLESAKASMMMLFIATMMFSWDILRISRPRWSRRKRAALVTLLMVNPVVMQALVWLKDDSPLYYVSLLTLILSYYIIYDRNRVVGYIGLAAVIVISVSMKVNHFFYEGIFIMSIIAGMIIFHRQEQCKRYLFTTICSVLFAAIIVNFHPYITNTILYGNPLFPFFGKGGVDVGNLMPVEYTEGGRLSNLMDSYFTWHRFRSLNQMNEGGIFMPLISVLTLALIVAYQIRIRKFTRYSYALLVILAASLIFPQGWKLRYVCFLWLTVGVAYFLWIDSQSRLARIGRNTLLVLSVMNGLLYLILSTYSCLSMTAYRRATATVLSGERCMVYKLSPSAEYQLRRDGVIPYSTGMKPDSTTAIVEYYPGDRDYFPSIIVTPAQKQSIDSMTASSPQIRIWQAGLDVYHGIMD